MLLHGRPFPSEIWGRHQGWISGLKPICSRQRWRSCGRECLSSQKQMLDSGEVTGWQRKSENPWPFGREMYGEEKLQHSTCIIGIISIVWYNSNIVYSYCMFYAYSCIQYTCVFMHGRMTIIYSHMISLSCIIWIPANMPFISSQEDTYFGLCRDPGLCLSMSKNLAWATNILHETLQFRHVGAEESLASRCLFFSYWFSGWCFFT